MAARSGGRPQGGDGAVSIIPGGADRFGELVINTGTTFVAKHPAISASWVLGLLVSILATGFAPSFEAQSRYETKLLNLDIDSLARAEEDVHAWSHAYQSSKGWLWSCDGVCQENRARLRESQRELDRLQREYDAGVAQAKSELGLFSQYGVEEARELFWGKVAGGKAFAKRATMYDAVFAGFSSMRRDEGVASFLVKMVFRLVVNLTLGLFGAVVGFLFSVWKVIWSYQPDPMSSLAFFAAAGLAAVSLLATWLLGLAGATAGGVYVMAKAAEASMQIEAEQRAAGGRGGRPGFAPPPGYQNRASGQQSGMPGARPGAPPPTRPHRD